MNLKARRITHSKLVAFDRRRRALLIGRGTCIIALTVLILLPLIALLDYLIIIPDQVRWILSLIAYGVAIGAAWVTSFRYLFGKHGDREVARIVERAAPELREKLLSSVELGEASEEEAAKIDSVDFRRALQDDVANRVSGLDIKGLLPLSRIGKWLKYSGGLAVLVIILCFIPGLRFPQFFTRALLPGVNLARPFARRAFMTLRPALVDMRARKPWVRLRCVLLG